MSITEGKRQRRPRADSKGRGAEGQAGPWAPGSTRGSWSAAELLAPVTAASGVVLTAQPRPRVLTSTFSPIFICIPCPWTRRLSCILQALERSGPGVGRVGAPRTCRGQAAGCGVCGPPAGSQPARHPPPAPALPSPLRRLLWKMLLVFQTCTGTPRKDTEQDSPPLSSHQDPRRE